MATDAELRSSLATGEIEVQGRLASSSNGALLVTTSLDGVATTAIYKPVMNEQPLWDFPEQTLGRREVAARVLDRSLWNLIPETVMRYAGPFGPGMCQIWIEAEPIEFVRVFPDGLVADGWLPVLRAYDTDENPVVVAHPDTVALRKVALFDAITNNADRKAGHLLADPDGRGLFSVDHGLTFNVDPKLRTVLWGFAGEEISPELLEGVEQALADSSLDGQLRELLSDEEVDAFHSRASTILVDPHFPLPPVGRNPIPWPLV